MPGQLHAITQTVGATERCARSAADLCTCRTVLPPGDGSVAETPDGAV